MNPALNLHTRSPRSFNLGGDLVSDLRLVSKWHSFFNDDRTADLLSKAADEINTLRIQVQNHQKQNNEANEKEIPVHIRGARTGHHARD